MIAGAFDLGYAVAPFDSELRVAVYAARSGEASFALEGKDGRALCLEVTASGRHTTATRLDVPDA